MSDWRFSRAIALRYLRSRRGEAFITIITVVSILGVALGVMVLNIVMAVMTGFEHELREKIVGTNSHILVRKFGGKIDDWREAKEKIKSVDGVATVSAFTYNQALLKGPQGSVGILIRGVEPDSSGEEQLRKFMEREGTIEKLFEPNAIEIESEHGIETVELPGLVVGRELVRSLNLFIGSPVALLSPSVTNTPFGLVPKYKRYVLVGSYRSGLVEYESGLAYMSLAEAQRFFQMGEAVSGIEVRVHHLDDSRRITGEIMSALGGSSGGFYAQDWTESNKALWEAINLEKRAYFVVLLLIVIMASFSIVTTLIMIVLEKRKDIAVLITMGAKPSSISRIFIIQGAVIGGLGTVLGLILGWAGCVALREYGFPLDESIFQMAQLPIRMEWENFLLTAGCAFAICCVATIYPARRAARLDPCETLRYE